jgi:hypothetical protein
MTLNCGQSAIGEADQQRLAPAAATGFRARSAGTASQERLAAVGMSVREVQPEPHWIDGPGQARQLPREGFDEFGGNLEVPGSPRRPNALRGISGRGWPVCAGRRV